MFTSYLSFALYLVNPISLNKLLQEKSERISKLEEQQDNEVPKIFLAQLLPISSSNNTENPF